MQEDLIICPILITSLFHLFSARVQVWFQNRRKHCSIFFHYHDFELKILFLGAKWRKNERIDDPTNAGEYQHNGTDIPSTSKPLQDCEQPQSVPQQQSMIDHESSKLLSNSTADDRLSPNLFLNLNFETSNALDSNSGLKFEWTNFPNLMNSSTTSIPSNLSISPVPINHINNINHNKNSFISSPTYEFLNVDQFNMDNFKNECILNLDHNLMNTVNDTTTLINPMPPSNRNIDLHGFSLSDTLSETKELLDLEKPMNINISDKYQ